MSGAPPFVFGNVVDAQTRCVHYQSELDIVAIRFKCCDKYYPCFKCHNEAETHAIVLWPREEFSSPAILCGVCRTEITIDEYMQSSACSRCQSPFNPRCSEHYHIYFEVVKP